MSGFMVPDWFLIGGAGLGVDADSLVLFGRAFEADCPIDEGEQGMIAPHADVVARLDRGAALSDEDRPGQHRLTVASLDAKALALAVAPVTGAAHPLLVG